MLKDEDRILRTYMDGLIELAGARKRAIGLILESYEKYSG